MARILVVENEPTCLTLATTMLSRAGHDVIGAVDGERGIEAALTQAPGMDGVAALKHLRADPRSAGIKVAALTAYAMKGERERFLAEGFDDYLDKPIRFKEFAAYVEALLPGKSPGA
jgi:two-component system, cell cycle response regulator DivK